MSRLLDVPAWHVVVEAESARCRRYGRVSTLVLVEVVGRPPRPAPSPLAGTSPAIAAALERESRTSDLVARLAEDRFSVLLTETGEIAAINFVERVRDVCNTLLASVAPDARVAVGWAEISGSRDGARALDYAFGRLLGDANGERLLAPTPAFDVTDEHASGNDPDNDAHAEDTPADPDPTDLDQVRRQLAALPAGRRHDPYWDLEGRTVRRGRRARRAVRLAVSLLAAVILAIVLARLITIDSGAVLFGPNRHLVFVAAVSDAVACGLVFIHQLFARRTRLALLRPSLG